MKKLVTAFSASVAVGLVALGTALAHGPGPVHAPTGRVVTMHARTAAELTIVHIVRGCHNWTDGKTIAEKADVTLRHGGRLTILNQDVDLHKVVQLAGPRIPTGKAMTMNASFKLRFAKAGLYRFKTVTSEMPGMPEMKTIGPDYQLILIVHAR
jgi:plastocyanin